MTKYKWSLLGLILSVILFIVFLISPLIKFINTEKFHPIELLPENIAAELESVALASNKLFDYRLDVYGSGLVKKGKLIEIKTEDINKYKEIAEKDFNEWYSNVPKKFKWSSLGEFGKSFYHWNLFWIPIIIFSVLTVNYKKEN